MRFSGNGLGVDLNDPQSQEMLLAGNLLNPFDWFNGSNQKMIKNMDEGGPEEFDTKKPVGAMMERNRRLNELMNRM